MSPATAGSTSSWSLPRTSPPSRRRSSCCRTPRQSRGWCRPSRRSPRAMSCPASRWLSSRECGGNGSLPSAEQLDGPPYALQLSASARRALSEQLPSSAAFATWEFVSGPLLQRPRVVGEPLRKPFRGLWRARRGEYRVRYGWTRTPGAWWSSTCSTAESPAAAERTTPSVHRCATTPVGPRRSCLCVPRGRPRGRAGRWAT